MAALTIAWVVVSFTVAESSATLVFDVIVWVILGAEFITRLLASPDRGQYLRGHWIDAIALIPAARPLRLLRLFRLVRLVRAFSGVYRALTSLERFASNRQLIGLFLAWIGVAVICSTALYLAETGSNEDFSHPADALWWGVVTLTTVGYGDVYPTTLEGKLAAGGLMIIGITLFAAITGTITSALIASHESGSLTPADRLRDLEALLAESLISEQEYAEKRETLVAEL